jgi:hypothetical protein
MPKAVSITADDLTPARTKPKAAARQRGEVPSADLVPIQFRMPPDFVRQFKQAALDDNMKLNELLKVIFHEYQQKYRKKIGESKTPPPKISRGPKEAQASRAASASRGEHDQTEPTARRIYRAPA